MKNWNGLDNAAAPVEHPRSKVRWHALTATFVTLVCFAAVDTIFPALKRWKIPFVPDTELASHAAAFEWNEVCLDSVAWPSHRARVFRTPFKAFPILSGRIA